MEPTTSDTVEPLWLDTHSEADLVEHVSPENVQLTLRRVGTLLAGWELVRRQVEDETASSFACSWDLTGPEGPRVTGHSPDYRTRVLDRHRSRFVASALWLRDQDALTPPQLDALLALRAHRNEVAHELPRFRCDPTARLRVDLLLAARGCLASLGRFWGTLAVQTDPDLDPELGEVDYAGIRSMSLLLYDHLLEAGGVLAQR